MSGNKINLTSLKKYLGTCSQNELEKDIQELFKRIPAVKDYYQVKLDPQSEDQVLDKYKKIIRDEFFPNRGLGRAKLSVARKAVTDYKKVAGSTTSIGDLMVFYVEQRRSLYRGIWRH